MSFVVGFSGSPRKDGNTQFLVREVLAAAAAAGADTRFHDLNEAALRGCQACMACKQPDHVGRCAYPDFEELSRDIERADGIVLGAPVYIGSWSGQFKTFLDRWYRWRSPEGWRLPSGKRAVVICCCGAPAEQYQDLLQRAVRVMSVIGLETRGLMAAGLQGKDAARRRPELLNQAGQEGLWVAGQ